MWIGCASVCTWKWIHVAAEKVQICFFHAVILKEVLDGVLLRAKVRILVEILLGKLLEFRSPPPAVP